MLNRRTLGLSLAALGAAAMAGRASAFDTIAVPMEVGPRLLIKARLNGQGPFDLIIDTGAEVSGIQTDIADRIGLRAINRVRLNNGMFPLYSASEVVFGDAFRQADMALFGLDMPRLGGDGLLAAGVLTTFDSELDFGRGEWRVHPQGGLDLSGFERLPSEFRRSSSVSSHLPFADVSVGDRIIRPLWDTGAPRALTLSHALAQRLGLWRDDKPYGLVPLSGITGMADQPGRAVRVPSITIGAERFENVLVALRPAGLRGVDAVLGLPMIQTMDLALDRSERAVHVRRNTLSQGPDFHYGLAGTWLESARGGVRIAMVSPGSPAARAGLRVGDMVQGEGGLHGAIHRLAGGPGMAREMTVRRGEEILSVRMTLIEYL